MERSSQNVRYSTYPSDVRGRFFVAVGYKGFNMLGLLMFLGLAGVGFLVIAFQPTQEGGRCAQCGYSKNGTASGVCPECGKAHQAGETHRRFKVSRLMLLISLAFFLSIGCIYLDRRVYAPAHGPAVEQTCGSDDSVCAVTGVGQVKTCLRHQRRLATPLTKSPLESYHSYGSQTTLPVRSIHAYSGATFFLYQTTRARQPSNGAGAPGRGMAKARVPSFLI